MAREELCHRLPRGRIDQRRRDLCERLQNEDALAKARMRYLQTNLVDHPVTVQDKVEIERPWRVRERPFASAIVLNGEKRIQQRACRKGRLPDRGGVEKHRLRT